MSVRSVLQWPAEASHVLARSDRYKVTHTNSNIPKYVERKALCRLVAIPFVVAFQQSAIGDQESDPRGVVFAPITEL
jgi:hypothetical protein